MTTALLPTRYSDRDNSTFFDVAGILIRLDYQVIRRKSWLVLPGAEMARLEARIGDSPSALAHEYEMPRSHRVGAEVAQIERGLYGFMDEVIRTTMQLRALESAEKKVEALEAEHLFFEPATAAASADEPSSTRGRAAAERRVLDELVDRVITAVQHLTNVTSLTRDGLAAYERDRKAALDRVLEATSLTSAVRMQGILAAVEAFLRYETESTSDLKALRERTLDYLPYLQSRQRGATVSEEQAQVIANEFVPAYLEMKRSYEAAVRFPRDIVGHAFGSFFAGGFTGWITISVFGEPVIRGLTGTSLDLPGWYIGAVLAFIWPYLRAFYGSFTRESQYESRRQALLERISRRLELTWPSSLPPAS